MRRGRPPAFRGKLASLRDRPSGGLERPEPSPSHRACHIRQIVTGNIGAKTSSRFAWSIDAQSNLIGILNHKTQKKNGGPKIFPRFFYCGRRRRKWPGAGLSAMLFYSPSFLWPFFFFCGNSESSVYCHIGCCHRYQTPSG